MKASHPLKVGKTYLREYKDYKTNGYLLMPDQIRI